MKNFFLKNFKIVSFLIIFHTAFFNYTDIKAEPVNWRLEIGGFPTLLRYKEGEVGRKFTFKLGLEIQVPIKTNFFIESGLSLRYAPTTYTFIHPNYEDYEFYNIPVSDFANSNMEYTGDNSEILRFHPGIEAGVATYLDIPVRFGYKLIFNEKNQIQFGLGPYIGLRLTSPLHDGQKIKGSNCVSVGLIPSVVYKHRALTLGLSYQNPFIYNGTKNREVNTLMFSIGINFRGKKINLDKLADGLSVASSALNGATQIMQSYYGTSYDSTSDNQNSTTYDSGNTRTKIDNDSNDFSLSKKTSADRDRQTYNSYITIVQNINRGDDTTNKKKDIQKKMKRLREKWANTPYSWPISEWETK